MIKNRNATLLMTLLMTVLILISCNNREERITQKAKDKLLNKVNKYTQKIQDRCWDKIRQQSERDVDSFLLSTAKQSKVKQIDKPSQNDRPDRPEVDFPDFVDPNE